MPAAVGALALFGVVTLIGLMASGIIWHGSDAASAASSGPEMGLSVPPGDTTTCPSGTDPGHVCIDVGSSFTLSIEAIGIPAIGYVLMQTYIVYGADLDFKQASASSEIVWPDCNIAPVSGLWDASGLVTTDLNVAVAVHHGCLSGLPPLPKSNHIGTLVSLSFNCAATSSSTEVKLLPDGDAIAATNGALYKDINSASVIPKVSNLFVDCVAPTPTPTDTPTETPTPTSTRTPTITSTPTMTPTPPPVESVSTPIGSGGGNLSTDIGPTPDAVEAELDIPEFALSETEAITIEVFLAEDIPEAVGDAQTLSRAFRFLPDGLTFDPPAIVTITYTDAEVVGIDESAIELIVYNSQTDDWEVATIIARDTVANTIKISMAHFSDVHTCHGDDCDEDGCTNDQEAGSDERFGGLRDMTNKNDFYDVNGDRFIDLTNDIFEVIQHYAPMGTEPEYDVNFDRGPSEGPNVWNMTAPDGVIDLTNDIFGVIQQYFHDCQNP
ncbi:MAG: hypothetical protein IH865_09445 [Chloroflexi bacterium]|nr:hypothetical protein [Chloroflexota bacterium]